MADFDLTTLLNNQSTAGAAPAQRMVISMIPRGDILRNPENKIYIIGDVSRLAEDIAANGLRQPLEVIPAGEKYMLIGGERRLTACEQLAAAGDKRFDRLPCVVRTSAGAAQDRIALITANATARELTDGERLDQYIAMKAALEELKQAGKLDGRVRDEMARRLGESGGSLGRLGAIAANCTDEVKQMIRDGKCGFMRAYEASKLPPRKQRGYAETGSIPPTPPLMPEQKKAVEDWLLTASPAVPWLKTVDYGTQDMWSFSRGSRPKVDGIIQVPGPAGLTLLATVGDKVSYVAVNVPDPADETDTLYTGNVLWMDLYERAKRRYWPKEAAAQARRASEEQKARDERARQAHEQVEAVLKAYRDWPVECEMPTLGLKVYAYALPDGSRLCALAGDDPPQFRWPMYRHYGVDGKIIPKNGCTGWDIDVYDKDTRALIAQALQMMGGKNNETM